MKYEPSLDGMRAFAVTGVVLAHALPGSRYIPGGGIGVDVFFVLSGFLITRIISAELSTTGTINLKQFYTRRLLRLTPPLAFLLITEAIFEFLTSPDFAAHGKAALMAASYLMNWNRAFGWWPQGNLGHTWSLAIEEQFYLVWPALLIFIYPRRPIRWLLVIIVMVLAWRTYLIHHGASIDRIYNGFDTHSDSLFIGCALGLFSPSDALKRTCLRWSPLPCLALIYIVHYYALNPWYETAASLATAWIIVCGIQDGWIRNLLSVRALVYTGKISYEWYLWHFPILAAGTAYFGQGRWTALAIGFSSYPVAALSYHFVGLPFLRLKARYSVTAGSSVTAKLEVATLPNELSPIVVQMEQTP